jgi:hypothetical protein
MRAFFISVIIADDDDDDGERRRLGGDVGKIEVLKSFKKTKKSETK